MMFHIIMILICVFFLALNATERKKQQLTPVSNIIWTIALVLNILIVMGVI